MTAHAKPIDKAWRSYAEQVIPVQAPLVQHMECRRAFYAGAHALMCAILEGLDPSCDDPTPDDFKLLDDLRDELDQFNRDVQEGRA